RGGPGFDLQRHGHAHTAALEDAVRAPCESGGREELTGGITIGTRRGVAFGSRPERRNEIRPRHASTAGKDVFDQTLPMDGELDGFAYRGIREEAVRREAQDLERLGGGVEDVEAVRVTEAVECAREIRLEIRRRCDVDVASAQRVEDGVAIAEEA